MNKEEIDELLVALSSNDEKIISEIFEHTREELEKMPFEQFEEYIKKVYSRIMSEIEKGDYEYFIKKFEDINYSELINTLIEFESQQESKEKVEWQQSIKKQVLHKIRESKTIDEKRKYDFIPLIKSIKDIDFLKECIEKRDEYGFDKFEIRDIIKLVGDDKFTKECIDRREELGINDKYRIIELIETINDHEIKKECIIELKDDTYASSLIERFYSEEEIIEFIKTKKIEGQDLKINILERLICYINDDKPLYEILSKKEKREEYGISKKDVVLLSENAHFFEKDTIKLIEAIGDSEFTKECIERRDELHLGKGVLELIKMVGDIDYTINCIINWQDYTNDEDKIINLIKSIEYFKDLDFIDYHILNSNENPIDCIIERSSPEFLIEFWNKISDDLKRQCGVKIINTLDQLDATDELMSIIKPLSLNEDKLMELLTIKDSNYLKKHIIHNIILKGIKAEEFTKANLDEEIDKLYDVFLTTNLPTIFKEFEFFKNHDNYESTNEKLYAGKTISERDANIKNDLFRISLESNNKQLRAFLESLYNGNIALTKKQNGEEISEIEEAIILKYRDIVYDLLDIAEDNNIKKSEDMYGDFEKIKSFLNIEDGNIGETLLNKYFDKIGLKCNTTNNSTILKLLEYMDLKKESSQRKNIQEFKLEAGDLIKGTSITFIEEILKNGIRAKEFFMEGSLHSDATPLDADFSEIKPANLGKDNLAGIIDSTCTNRGFGKTWIVIKNNNYNSEDRELNYAIEDGANSTRYFRTGIGSTNISAIVTAEWNDELKFLLAQNEFYIPVKDFETEEILFTFDEYQEIRQQMGGLTHYSADKFIISENANNENILNQASELRKKAEGEISTEEKREKIISLLRSKLKKVLLTEIGGDISKESIELIDTGSTGRGTNIPGDGDFDFMLKCSSIAEQKELIEEIKTILVGNEKGGTNEFNIRYTDVKIEGLESTVEVDITTEQKRLETEYSSDMCIRERLDTIKRTYGDEQLNAVIDNILVAKKVLKENGLYKKTGSVGSTEYGGFGGIGVENWILQNGGSFIEAMQTFLENAIDKDGNEIEFEEFKKKYPIYDFGQNHRDKKDNNEDKKEHDHYIEGLSECGFKKMKEIFKTLLIEYEIEQSKKSVKEKFFDSIIDRIKVANEYKMSDMSQIYGLLAKMRAYYITKESKGENLEI